MSNKMEGRICPLQSYRCEMEVVTNPATVQVNGQVYGVTPGFVKRPYVIYCHSNCAWFRETEDGQSCQPHLPTDGLV